MLFLGLGAAPAFGGASADKAALYIGKPAEHRQHQAPGAGAGVGPRFRQGPKLCLGVDDTLDGRTLIPAVDVIVIGSLAWSTPRQPQSRRRLSAMLAPFIDIWPSACASVRLTEPLLCLLQI